MSDQETAPGPLAEPVDFGPYELLELLRAGLNVDVYLARTRGIEGFARSVSLRCLRDSTESTPELISDFVEQAKRASSLQHANIAQVLDLGKVGETYYVAAEYVAGPTLDELARRVGGPLPPPIAVHVAIKVLEALEYAHNRTDEAGHAIELLHSGIAPGDVAVSSDGQVKLLTFGESGASRSGIGSVGVLSGRIGYMSPEQVRGLALDRRSDTFAVGVILHEMLTGRSLFLGDTEFEVLEKIRKVEVTPPSLLNPDVPPQLEDLVLKALNRSPASRFQTANHMARELQKWSIGADAFLGDDDIRVFVSDEMPDLIAPSTPPETPEPVAPDPPPIPHGLDWDDEEIETALFARYDGMIPRPGMTPDPDQELGEWSRDHATGVRRRPDSASGPVPVAENADLGDLAPMPLPSGEIPAIGILTSPDATTGFEPTAEEVLRDNAGEERAMPASTVPFAQKMSAELDSQPTSTPPTLAATQPFVQSTDLEPRHSTGLGWLVLVATIILIGLVITLLQTTSGASSAVQIAVTPVDVDYTILIDGTVVYEGRVPTALTDVPPGTHQLTVRADGYRDRTEFIEVGLEGAELIDWEILSVPTVTVPFNSAPLGATVTVDGVVRGETPIEVDLVVGALVEVEIQLAGHDSHASNFIVTERFAEVTVALTEFVPGATVEVPIVATPEGATYTVTSQPGGEVVARGNTPAVATIEIGGSYRVSLMADGYESALTPLVGTDTGFEPFRVELRPIAEANEVGARPTDATADAGDGSDVEEETEPERRREETEREEREPEAVAANDESEREAAELAEREAAERQATEREEAERETASAQDAERERQAAQEQRERRMREEAEAEARNVEEPPAAVDGPPGFINVQSTPPARIVIDGSDTGMTTPANGIQLSSGIRHRVELINEATDLHRTYRISLEPGQVRNIVNRSN